MVVVTKHKYYLDDNIKAKFDFCITRQKKNFDHLFIYDGDEGYGKSTCVVGHANYVAEATGKPFTVDNVFFDLDKMLDFASKTEEQIIVWDEAALGGMSINWQNKVQQKLVQMLMVARKKRHWWFFVIPKFFRLNEYLVVDRAIGLVHVYSPDDMERGQFTYYDKSKKNSMYYKVKKAKIRNYKNYTFRGRFVKKGFVIDEAEYDRRKDLAILSIAKEDDVTGNQKKIIKIQYRISQLDRYNTVELGELFDANCSTISKWKKLILKYPTLADNVSEGSRRN